MTISDWVLQYRPFSPIFSFFGFLFALWDFVSSHVLDYHNPSVPSLGKALVLDCNEKVEL